MGNPRITRAVRSLMLLAGVLILAGCAAKGNNVARVDADHVVGFWYGLWHGLISPITFLISLFTDHVNIYDVHNNGNWYNFGFIFGVSMAFSGGAHSAGASRRSSCSRRDSRQP